MVKNFDSVSVSNATSINLSNNQISQVTTNNSSSSMIIPTNIDAILKKFGLTIEAWQALSSDKQLEYVNKYNQEQNTISDDNPDLNSDSKKSEISTEQWKNMTSEQRIEVVYKFVNEKLDLENKPKENRQEVVNSYIDSILESKDQNYETYSKEKQKQIKTDFLLNAGVAIKDGLVPEDFKSMSYEDILKSQISVSEELESRLSSEIEKGNDSEIAYTILNESAAKKAENKQKYELSQTKLTEEEYNKTFLAKYLKNSGNSKINDENEFLKQFKTEFSHVKRNERAEFIATNGVALLEYAKKNKNPELEEMVVDKLAELGYTPEMIKELQSGNCSKETIEKIAVINRRITQYDHENYKNGKPLNSERVKKSGNMAAALVASGIKSNVDDIVVDMYKEEMKSFQSGVKQVPGNKDVSAWQRETTPQIKNTEAQMVATEATWDYTKTFEKEEDKKEAQKQYSDMVPELKVENQGKAYEFTMTSDYDEVKEYAASNIYKLDESVRDYAVKVTKALGNDKITNAIQTKAPDNTSDSSKTSKSKSSDTAQNSKSNDVQGNNSKTTTQTPEQQYKQAVQNYSNSYAKFAVENNEINKNQIEPDELKGLSKREKYQKAAEYFLKSTPVEQYRMLSKLTEDQRKTVIAYLCKQNSPLLKDLISQGLGRDVLSIVGKSAEVSQIAVAIMLRKGGSDAKLAADYVMSTQSSIHYSDDTMELALQVTGKDKVKTVSEYESKEYTSNPNGFVKNTLYPPKSAIYKGVKEFFYKA